MPEAGPSEKEHQRLHTAGERDITTMAQPFTKQINKQTTVTTPGGGGWGQKPVSTVAIALSKMSSFPQQKITKCAKT